MPPQEEPQNSQINPDNQADTSSSVPPPYTPTTPETPPIPQAAPPQPPVQPQVPAYVQPNPTGPQVAAMPTASVGGLGQPAAASVKPRKIKPLLILVAVMIVIVIAAAAFLILNKSSKNKTAASNGAQANNVTVKVPASWKKVNSGMGFSVFAPAGWSLGTPTGSDFNDLNDKSAPISATGGAVTLGETTQSQIDQSVSIGVENLTGDKSEAAFDNKVTKLSSDDAATLKAFGVDTSKITVTSKRIEINGRPWLEVHSNIPGQYSDNLYYWVKDHAITFVVTSSSQAKLKPLSQNYLFPMAASMILN